MEKQLNINGANQSYQVFGKGKPVMLVHGFGESRHVWRNQVTALQDKFRLIVPNLPGTGKSEDVDDMSLPGLAKVLKQIFDQELIDSTHESAPVMIGHSMGGYITLAFVDLYPQFLSSFGLLHSTSKPDSPDKIETRKKGINVIKEKGVLTFIKSTTPNLFSEETIQKRPELVEEQVREADNFNAVSLVKYYEAMIERPDRTELLKTTSLPVLFILGKHDKAVPFEQAMPLVQLPKVSYIDLLQNSGHLGMLEEAEKTNKALEKFLTET